MYAIKWRSFRRGKAFLRCERVEIRWLVQLCSKQTDHTMFYAYSVLVQTNKFRKGYFKIRFKILANATHVSDFWDRDMSLTKLYGGHHV